MKTLALLFTAAILSVNIYPQSTSLFVPLNYQKAYEKGTRSQDGTPGPAYWQNSADYKMNVSVDPATRKLSGEETITYYNNSPDTLKEITIHLFSNIYKKGAARDFSLDPVDESDGVVIERMKYKGANVDVSRESKDIDYATTYFQLKLKEPLLPGSNADLQIKWNYILNKGSEIRTGTVDETTFFCAYFFPRIAVYDDIDGWNTSEYTGQCEFYNDFSNFDVNVTMPKDYLVWATGMLQNADKVLNEKYYTRYKEALISDKIIKIIDSTESISKKITTQNSTNTFNFKAENVTDFAFGTSDHYLWDGVSYVADKNTGRRVFISAVYNKASHDYYMVDDAAEKVINYLSTEFPGVPYPFPAMTVFNGHSGMEYPMMVNDVSEPDSSMPGLTAHEVSHSYFPFYMGINETKYAYMDEGWAAFLDYQISSNVFGNEYIVNARLKTGLRYTGRDLDMPIFSISKYLKSPVYRNNAYIKAAIFYNTVKDLLGDDLFRSTIQKYIAAWNGKHPIPHDFFNILSKASGQDLTWLIKPWFFEFGYVDLAVDKIVKEKNNYIVPVELKGNYPAPVKLRIYFADGSVEEFARKVDVWKNGNKLIKIEVPGDKVIKRAVLLNKFTLDVVPSNDEQVEKIYN